MARRTPRSETMRYYIFIVSTEKKKLHRKQKYVRSDDDRDAGELVSTGQSKFRTELAVLTKKSSVRARLVKIKVAMLALTGPVFTIL
jgi:hypothetical protein